MHKLQIDDFFQHSGKCQDYLGLCEVENGINGLDEDETRLSFINTWTEIPINYFCTFDMQKSIYPSKPSNFTIHAGRTLVKKLKLQIDRAFAMWENYCPEINNTESFDLNSTNTTSNETF